jgi:hypothetical protein
MVTVCGNFFLIDYKIIILSMVWNLLAVSGVLPILSKPGIYSDFTNMLALIVPAQNGESVYLFLSSEGYYAH